MESIALNSSNLNIRTDLCLIVLDQALGNSKNKFWTEPALDFVRKILRHELHLTLVGPKFSIKLGSKKNFRLLDRHRVVGMKNLETTRSHPTELRIIGVRSKSWIRLRTENVVVIGGRGIYPKKYEGWSSDILHILESFQRWIFDFKTLPGQKIVFIGSSNANMRAAIQAIEMGAKRVTIIEESDKLQCWRAYEDAFVSKGGRYLLQHQILKLEKSQGTHLKNLFVKNDLGVMIIDTDCIVQSHVNHEALNGPEDWNRGYYYYHLRHMRIDPSVDEEEIFEKLDWEELYLRIARKNDLKPHKDIEGRLKQIKLDRKALIAYRQRPEQYHLKTNGKILDRDSLSRLQLSNSVPRTFVRQKPVASLECFEQIPCTKCGDECPEEAIEFDSVSSLPKLSPDKCTGCGICVSVCPSSAAIMIQENQNEGKARYYLSESNLRLKEDGGFVQLLNRKGEVLGQGKRIGTMNFEETPNRIAIIEASDVFTWEARFFRPQTKVGAEDPNYLEMLRQHQQHNMSDDERGWITLNGAKRIAKLKECLLITLGKSGMRRFEDALFCNDGSCGLCEIRVDGKPVLACQTNTKEGMEVIVDLQAKSLKSNPLCYCKQIETQKVMEATLEKIPQKIMQNITGFGQGKCHGRWCMHSSEVAQAQQKLRPVFPGFEQSPWINIGLDDLLIKDE